MVRKVRKCQILAFFYFMTIFSKTVNNVSLLFAYSLLGNILNKLSRDGFDWVIQKVICEVGKVMFGLFYHNYRYYSVVTQCCPILLHHVVSLVETNPVLKYERCGITLGVIFKVRKVQCIPLWSIELISQKRCIIWLMFLLNTYIYNLSVYINTFGLRWHL